jgi:hypothetical protein
MKVWRGRDICDGGGVWDGDRVGVGAGWTLLTE